MRVLLIEDDADDVLITRAMLREAPSVAFEMDHTSDTDVALQAMCDNSYDVYLLDYRLGPVEGADLLTTAIQAGCHSPVVMLTGQRESEIAERAMRAGADDYLEKGRIDGRILERAIRYAFERKRIQREQERLLQDLNAINERFRVALINSPVSVSNQDLNLCYTWAHNTIFGHDPCKVIGLDDFHLLDDASAVEQLTSLKRDVIRSRQGARIEVKVGRHEAMRAYDLTIEPQVVRGEIVGITTAQVDITQVQQALEMQRNLNTELDRRVRQRTEELEQANQEMGSFTYSVAHDLRAPLRAIHATSSILCHDFGDKLGPEGVGLLTRQAYNAKRLAGLIDDLLHMSRLTRHEIVRTDFSLSELAEIVASTLTAHLEGAPRIVVDPDMEVCADHMLVQTVLENLIGNAIKFSPGGGTIRVGGRNPVFFVKDEGVGFDMKYAHKLFRPFERLVAEDQFAGNGIGLASVKRVVEKHGGEVWAESIPGDGSCFYFTLEPGVIDRSEPNLASNVKSLELRQS